MSRTIFLCDMNSFFASVHQAVQPELKGRPVIVGGTVEKRTGIVLAASVEAKKLYGIKTGMFIGEAKIRCKDAVYFSPDHRLYAEFSNRINNLFLDFTDLVEPYSIDESYLDVTGCIKLLGNPLGIAREIQRRINEEIGIGVNIGIGSNKLMAKMAAELEKPNKIISLTAEEWPARIFPLPVKELFGVGSRIGKWLASVGVHTIGDLARLPAAMLKKRYGLVGETLHYSANGIDHAHVNPNSLDVKSIGNQITLPRDYQGYEQVKVVILELAEEVGERARKAGSVGKRISLTIKDPSFFTDTHSKVVNQYTNITDEIYQEACYLLEKHWKSNLRARLIGVTLSELIPSEELQMDLFNQRPKQEQLDKVIDGIRSKYGYGSIKRAVSMTEQGVYYGRKL